MTDKVPVELVRARVSLTFDYPFWGYLALTLEPVEALDLNPPTMGTDGIHLYYHPDFIRDTPIPQLQGVLAHEIMHCVLNHLARRQNRDPERFNVAADLAVNPLVLKEFQLPPGCLNDPQYYDKSAEYIYSNLPLSKNGEGGDGGTLDSHEAWKNAGKDKPDKSDGSGQAESAADALEQEWQQRVAMAATQARVRGKFPAHLESIVGDLLQPKLDWKALLRDRITSCAKNDYSLTPANKKHLWRGFYLPSISGEEINVAVGVDDSGSISDADIQAFLSEVKGICDAYDEYTIHLFIADAAIRQRFELHTFDPLPKLVQGRGGTDFRPVIAEVEKLDGVSSLIYFTDLFGSFPDREPRVPVIWVSTSDQKPPWGSLIPYPKIVANKRRK